MPLVALELNDTLVGFELFEAYDTLLDVDTDLWVHLSVKSLGKEAHRLDVPLIRLLLLMSLSSMGDLSQNDLSLQSFI